jgi:hypothetical protein
MMRKYDWGPQSSDSYLRIPTAVPPALPLRLFPGKGSRLGAKFHMYCMGFSLTT